MRGRLLLLPALVLVAVVYHPITRNYFFADDFLNLYHIANHSLLQYLVTPNGGHILLTRNAIFYLMERVFGASPEPYYWSILLTHLLNVWLLFLVLQCWTRSARLASFGAALWGVSPLNEGTLGWYAVYGQVLVATALLVLLLQAARPDPDAVPPFRTRCLWYALALAAATSFGTGLAIAMVLPLALLLLRPGAPGVPRLPPLLPLIVVVPAVYVLLTWAYQRLSGQTAFDLASVSALVADWRVMPRYLGHLMAFGLTRLALGFYFPDWAGVAVWYGFLICFTFALVVIMHRCEGQVRRQLAACILLLLACYGIVAFGRAFFLARSSMDVFMGFSRYHYVGQLILAIMLCVVLEQLAAAAIGRRVWVGNAALAGWYAVTVLAYILCGRAIDQPGAPRAETQRVLAAIQSAIDAQPAGQAVYIPNRRFEPLPLPQTIFPGWAAVFTIFYPDNTVDGRRVYFVDKRPDVIEATRYGRRTSTLLVAAGG